MDNKAKILIIDDEDDFRANLKYILEKKGYQVQMAANGVEGLRKLETYVPDLILMDVMMPELDGMETAAKIREQVVFKDVVIIFLTGVTAGADVITSINGQYFSMISKMTDYEILLTRIREHLDGRVPGS
jgi:two-component system alkaline phosphatase synthesis response regulator PhoP